MENLENKEIRKACDDCFREHDNKCVALFECCLGYSKTLEDLKTEYGFYVKAFKTECKHKKGTETITQYDSLNNFVITEVSCVSCHKLLLIQVFSMDKGLSVNHKTDINDMESV